MPGGFLFDVELNAIHAASAAFFAPYVKSGATTQAKADIMAQFPGLFLDMMNNASKSPPADPGPPA